jgi:hypothetical protein
MNAFQNNLVNRNPETGVCYGYISSNALHPELVDTLLYGFGAINHSYNEYVVACAHNAGFDPLNDDVEQAEEYLRSVDQEDVFDYYEDNESIISGEHDGVVYQSSWMGGALNFWIFYSPHITNKARLASPCVPNAAILDTLDGEEEGYDVPADWRADSE